MSESISESIMPVQGQESQDVAIVARNTAVASFVLRQGLDVSPEKAPLIIGAKVEIAGTKASSGEALNPEEQALVHLGKVVSALDAATEKGLIGTALEAEDLADALVHTPDFDPFAALRHLTKKVGLLERPLTPTEVAGALTLHQDLPGASLSTLARAADAAGVVLTPNMGELDIAAVLGEIELGDFDVTFRRVVTDWRGNPTTKEFTRSVSGGRKVKPVSDAQVGSADGIPAGGIGAYVEAYADFSGDPSVLDPEGSEPRRRVVRLSNKYEQ